MHKIFLLLTVMVFWTMNTVFAAEKIIFVPLDTRPITDRDMAMVVKKAGCDVLTPPEEFLGTESNPGNPEKLWTWLEKNAPNADAAVVSTDSMIYGSLVASRNHTLTNDEVQNRVMRFQKFHNSYPNLKIYAFGTVLRTLLTATHSAAGMEPAEYQANAVKIYHYSALLDKSEMGIAKKREIRELNRLESDINQKVMEDWKKRHSVNYNANLKLSDLTKGGVFSFFLLGGDDSAMYSATHREARMLKDYAASNNIWRTKFQMLSGADELGMMMLSRAVMDLRGEVPFIHTIYNDGKGKETLPQYCFEPLVDEMKGAVLALGAMEVPNPARADIVLLINTAIDGKTYPADSPRNTKKSNASVRAFMKKLNNAIDKGYPVMVGDITYSNGADNALMEAVRKDNLQFKIRAYGGWNTATNSLGFLLGEGFLTKYIAEKDKNELLLYRYLDDWAYQSNVRQDLRGAIYALPGKDDPTGKTMGTKQAAAEKYATDKIREFAKNNIKLPPNISLNNLKITLPWKRTFECEVFF